jgi:hypothetical protein
VDREVSAIEKLVVDAAEAMPDDKFNFSPESSNIPGGEYKGVRTFAVQVKHVAASNYFIWSPVTGDKLPEGLKDGNGPENLKTKADIMQEKQTDKKRALTPEELVKFKLRPEDRPGPVSGGTPTADRPGSQLRPGLAPNTGAVGGGGTARPSPTTEGTYQWETLTK